MRRIGIRSFALGLFALLLLLAGAANVWAGESIPEVYSSEDRNEIEIVTSIASYVFATDTGDLKSVFLHFVPYGSKVEEIVPGTDTTLQLVNIDSIGDDVAVLKQDRPILRPITRLDFSFPLLSYTGSRAYEQIAGGFPMALRVAEEPVAFELGNIRTIEPATLVIEFIGEAAGVSVVKRYTIVDDPSYTVGLEIDTTNPGADPVDLRLAVSEYDVSGSRELVYLFDGERSSAALAPGTYGTFGGVGLLSKTATFFLRVDSLDVMPFRELGTDASVAVGVAFSAESGSFTRSFVLYAGRRRLLIMEGAGLGAVDNPGTGARMIGAAVRLLEWLKDVTGNYGWALILFTILTRIVMFPLMRKQFRSTAKMQRMQPKLKKIQDTYKDQPQILQQRMMELYKKEKISPLGCFIPTLLQFPILILLWRAITYSAEAMHLSSGFLWIADLSLRDPYYIFIVLTTAAMILQQRLMSPQASGAGDAAAASKKFGYIFPVMMAVFFASFPAGLWLYYFLSTLFGIGQQLFINWELARADAVAVGGDDVVLDLDVVADEPAEDKDMDERADAASEDRRTSG
ncbi:membrane protein insertase YidC [Candidatus Bipolaricaulota bacterium]|nr:membrane protein insertase YidC [Candidatus Bipolaricaulota bacterium]